MAGGAIVAEIGLAQFDADAALGCLRAGSAVELATAALRMTAVKPINMDHERQFADHLVLP